MERFNEAEKKRVIELGKELGIKVSFGNKESGIFIGDKKLTEFEDLFPELRER